MCLVTHFVVLVSQKPTFSRSQGKLLPSRFQAPQLSGSSEESVAMDGMYCIACICSLRESRRLLQLLVFQSHAKVFMNTDIYGGLCLNLY